MARQKKKIDKASENVVDYRHKNVKRLNIPPAGLAARGNIKWKYIDLGNKG